MRADLAIINGLLVDSRSIYPASLYQRGRIAGITRSPSDRPARVIDAQGLYILPGAIDGHVHMMDPGYTIARNSQRGPGRQPGRSHYGDRSPRTSPGFRRQGAFG